MEKLENGRRSVCRFELAQSRSMAVGMRMTACARLRALKYVPGGKVYEMIELECEGSR